VAAGDLLIVDELTLPLMGDEGASIQAADTLYYAHGGAVLTELALLGGVEVDGSGILTVPRHAVGRRSTDRSAAAVGPRHHRRQHPAAAAPARRARR
jgi:hypothetical protein